MRVASNSRKLAKLTKTQYGNIQEQSSLADAGNIVAAHPICFQLNNPGVGQYGPAIIAPGGGADRIYKVSQFNLSTGYPLHSEDEDHVPNGPQLFMKRVDLQFKFTGFVPCTHITIHILRQKKTIDRDYWNPQNMGHTFMPHLLYGMQNLAGFTANTIDTDTFQILQTRKVFMNSTAASSVVAVAANERTSDPTTSPCKYVTMKIHMNRVCKQLHQSVNETTGNDNTHLDVHEEDGTESKGGYSWDNQHPLSNIWCVVSCDDESAFGAAITGNAVRCHIIRKCVWRDNRG